MFGRGTCGSATSPPARVLAVERAPFLEKLAHARQRRRASRAGIEVRQTRRGAGPRRESDVSDALAVVDDYRRAARELGAARPPAVTAPRRRMSRSHLRRSARCHPSRRAARLAGVVVAAARSRAGGDARHARARARRDAAVRHVGDRRLLAGLHLSGSHRACSPTDELIATVERGELWTEGLLNVMPSPVLSVYILTNNIVVSLFAFCSGLVFGLGTFYLDRPQRPVAGRDIRLHRAARTRRPAVRLRGRARLRGAVVHLHRRRGRRATSAKR